MNGDGKGYYDKDGGHQGKDQGYGKGGAVPGSGDSRMEQKGKSGYRDHDQGQHRGDNGGKGGYSDRSRGGGEAYDGYNDKSGTEDWDDQEWEDWKQWKREQRYRRITSSPLLLVCFYSSAILCFRPGSGSRQKKIIVLRLKIPADSLKKNFVQD